jgi:iron complex transport system ATP-binding protein
MPAHPNPVLLTVVPPDLPPVALHLQAASLRLGTACFGPFELSVRQCEKVALLGPSGAGKSTLLKLMSGECRAGSGTVRVAGQPLAHWHPAALARQRAVLPQSHGVAFGLDVSLVVALGRAAVEPDPALAHVVEQALQFAHAGHLRGRRFDTLSGGEQARVQMARVFAQLWDVHHGLLLVDEPLAALDPGLQQALMDRLQAFVDLRGHALVAVLHDLNMALAAFTRLVLVSQGQVCADLPADRHAVPALERLYGLSLRCVAAPGEPCAVVPRQRPAASLKLKESTR